MKTTEKLIKSFKNQKIDLNATQIEGGKTYVTATSIEEPGSDGMCLRTQRMDFEGGSLGYPNYSTVCDQ